MNSSYSCFISYRRNDGDIKFIKNFKKIIESEAQKVTNIPRVFLDIESIKVGVEFDKKIYNSIVSSYFFIPIYHFSYLHVDNVWCARELYHALEVEKAVREKVKDDNYCYILPIIQRGESRDLPDCICKKNAITLKRLETVIITNKTTSGLTDFRNYIYETLLISFKLLIEKGVDIKEICEKIKPPHDDEIVKWINEQKEIERKIESTKLPMLKKNAK